MSASICGFLITGLGSRGTVRLRIFSEACARRLLSASATIGVTIRQH